METVATLTDVLARGGPWAVTSLFVWLYLAERKARVEALERVIPMLATATEVLRTVGGGKSHGGR